MIVGPADGPGEESFDLTVCTPEWLREQCRSQGGIYNPRHHIIVNLDSFDQRALRAWIESHIRRIEAPTWGEMSEKHGRLGSWEFEDYRA